MGISGLIPFLEKASTSINITQLQGSSVAVDSYCWLHKGVFACAEKLIRGETTDVYIQYCLKYVDMLTSHKIKIIMVFDGRHLPAKAETERRRREARKESKQLAQEYLRNNEIDKARSHMRRAVDVTHEMALELIKECRRRGIDCIVAPYEADAQMAWLNKQGLVEYVITEDSDLTLFGAQKILFKLDLLGQALLVENSKLYLAMGCKPEKYTFDKFRRMCILSGCDYLDSLQGIGLKKACKFILITEEDDMTKALKKMPSYLKMKQLEVTNEYIESFLKAEATFRHMFVYNPLEKKMQRLYELDEFQTNESHCCNAGSLLDDNEQAFQLALGNLNPFTLEKLDDWHPDRNWSEMKCKYKSIWINSKTTKESGADSQAKMTVNQKNGSIFQFKKIEFKNMVEIETQRKMFEECSKLEESEIFSMYKHMSPKMKQKRKRQISTSSEDEETNNTIESLQTPTKCANNPFAKVDTFLENTAKSPVCTNSSLLKLLSPKKSNGDNTNQQTAYASIQNNFNKASVKSRFFAENIKQIVKKPFASRDLTSEMLKIEEKVVGIIEQNKNLYHYPFRNHKFKLVKSELNTLNNEILEHNDKLEQNNKSIGITISNLECSTLSNVEDNKSHVFAAATEKNTLFGMVGESDSQKKISSSPSVHNTNTAFAQKIQGNNSEIKNKFKTSVKKAKKIAMTDSKQSKLSMFGFQKKTLLK